MTAVHVRPVILRSWEETSRLLAFLGLPPDQPLLRDNLDGVALLLDSLTDPEPVRRHADACNVFAISGVAAGQDGRMLLAGPAPRLRALAMRLSEAGEPLGELLSARLPQGSPPEVLSLPRGTLSLRRPLVQAILNITPDSFYDRGRYKALDQALERAAEVVAQGADIIDIGGESTRPGAPQVSEDEESARVVPVIEALVRQFDTPISIDTMKAAVARRAMEAGAQIVNDVTGLQYDPLMAGTVAAGGAALIVMHMRGTPRTMQSDTRYRSLVGEVLEVLEQSVEQALAAGVPRDRIVIDPGIGFAKTAADNLVLLKEVGALRCLGLPVLIGASRKSFLERVFGWKPEERLWGSLGAAAAAVMAGAQIVRVHDVLETRRIVDTVWAVREAGFGEASSSTGS